MYFFFFPMPVVYHIFIGLSNKSNEILGSPRFNNILAFDDFYTSPVRMPKNKVITLGELLQIWDSELAFSAECECEGKAYVYCFGSSIYSSKLTKDFWCSNCGKVFIDKKIKESFKELAQIRESIHVRNI